MQQRFCFCGHGIWVRYISYGFTPSGRAPFEAIFTAREDDENILGHCPHCGRHLDINDLF